MKLQFKNLKMPIMPKISLKRHGFEVLKAQSFNEFVVKFNQPIKILILN